MRGIDPNLDMPDPAIVQSLLRNGLIKDLSSTDFEVLAGGVSSDIWRVCEDDKVFCVKRALSKLKVAQDWFAPVERNRYEVAWYRIANKVVPGSAPQILAHDDEAMLCAMEYLDPETHKLWKSELRDGNADPEQAKLVGLRLAKIHAETAGDEFVEQQFPSAEIFQMIRLEPYLEATVEKHPDLKAHLFALSQRTAATRITMIHGDVSPKNILLGPDGPVFLDAECACIGDPAFDLAFCLNHFLLKCLWNPIAASGYIDCFHTMTSAYLEEVDWESANALEARAASLLPALFLARVDGRSPVEYVTAEMDKDKIRRCARALILNPPARLNQIASDWQKEISN